MAIYCTWSIHLAGSSLFSCLNTGWFRVWPPEAVAQHQCQTERSFFFFLFLFLKINKSLCPRSTDKQTLVWKFYPVGKQRSAFLSTLQCIWTGSSFVVTRGSLQTLTLASSKRSQWKPTGLVMVDLPNREGSLIRRKQTSQA